MAEYTFDSIANSYFMGQDMRITRERDGRTVIVNRKEGYWALNVKAEYVMRQRDPRVQTAAANLTDGLLSGLEEHARDFFWRDIEHLALAHGFNGDVFQEGRSGGWACVDETRHFESQSPANPHPEEREQVANWIAFCFDADDLRRHAEVKFDERILEANQDLQVELSEYAAWVGAEVQGLDGSVSKVVKLEVQYGRAALRGADGMLTCANESKLVRKADGQVPARLTADPIMEQVFCTIEDRGELSREQIDAALEDEANDPGALYDSFIGAAIDDIELVLKGSSA